MPTGMGLEDVVIGLVVGFATVGAAVLLACLRLDPLHEEQDAGCRPVRAPRHGGMTPPCQWAALD